MRYGLGKPLRLEECDLVFNLLAIIPRDPGLRNDPKCEIGNSNFCTERAGNRFREH